MSAWILNAAHRAFIQGDVTMYVAATGAAGLPQVARGSGCRVGDHNRITLFVSATRASAVLDAIRAHRTLAAVFAQPETHRAIQIKSDDATILPIQSDDGAFITDYCERIVSRIAAFGYTPAMLRAYFATSIDDVVAVHFTPASAFDQTPGPKAGTAMAVSA